MGLGKLNNLGFVKVSRWLAVTSILAISIMVSALAPRASYAQGLIVPSGSSLNINDGILSVSGSVVNSGTISTDTGSLELSGDWTNSGTFLSGTGSFVMEGTIGTQLINTGGTGLGNAFYNLTHTGSGTARFVLNNVDINGDFSNADGTVELNGRSVNVAGDWDNQAALTNTGVETVTFDGSADQTITGDTSFFNFTKVQAAAEDLFFGSGDTQTITGTFTMLGTNTLNLMTIDSTLAGVRHNLNLVSGGLQVIQFLDVNDSEATGIDLVGTDSLDTDNNDSGEGSPQWVFGGADIVWTGNTDNDWNDPTNWNLGLVPGINDTAIIPDVSGGSGNFPILDVNVSINSLTIQATVATVDLNAFNLSISGTLDNEGTIILGEGETVTINTVDTDSGTFRFIGDGDGVADTFLLPTGVSSYYNVVFVSSDTVNADTFQTNNVNLNILGSLDINEGVVDISTNDDDLIVVGDATIDGGTLSAAGGDLDIDGDLNIASGTLVGSNSLHTFTLAGDWTLNPAGTFTHSSGLVTLDGASHTITGTTTFYQLANSFSSGQVITFATGAGNATTIQNYLELRGASVGDELTVNSDAPGTQATMTLSSGVNATQDVQFVQVQDNDASGGLAIIARDSFEIVALSTQNWFFNGGTFTWQGDHPVNPTDWSEPTNWDVGIVPLDQDTAVIPAVANLPILDVNAHVQGLTIASSASVAASGFDLEIDGTLSNDGTIILTGTESTVSVGTVDTDSGLFRYIGDNNGATNNLTIFDLSSSSSVDYYNLDIDDTNITFDNFVSSNTVYINGLINVTSGNLDVSTNAGSLVSEGTVTINGGIFTATDATLIDANSDVIISSGTLVAPTTAGLFTVAADWTLAGAATFTNSGGEVEFDTTATSVITGDVTFYDLTFVDDGKTIQFTSGSTQTVEGTLTAQGGLGNEIVFASTVGGGTYFFDFPNSVQFAQFIDLSDSHTLTNNATCFNCIDNGGNDNLLAAPHWIFDALAITTPEDGKTLDTTPTLIGVGPPGFVISVIDSGAVTVGSTTIDANGNWRFEVGTASAMAVGPNTLQPCLPGPICGLAINVTIADPTTPQEVPTITSHTDGQRISGALPTLFGEGAFSDTVTILASDELGNLLLSTVGTGTTDGAGDWSVTLTTPLPKDTNYISVTIDGVASHILNVKLTDPFGVVFDSAGNQELENATVTIYRAVDNQPAETSSCDALGNITTLRDLDCDCADVNPGISCDVNPVITGADGAYAFIAVDADYYFTVDRSGYSYPSTLTTFPAGRVITTGSKAETFTVAGVVLEIDQPMDAGAGILRIEKTANKDEIQVGGIVTYTITMENLIDLPVNDVLLEDKIPPGFKYAEDRVILDDVPIANPTGNRPLTFNVGDFAVGQTRILKYQLIVGSGVTLGEYENTAFAKNSADLRISNLATESVRVVPDPLFDLGTVIGKVFFDLNENGIQDDPRYDPIEDITVIEDPVPNVRIAMEDGTIITTDRYGRFHVPALTPGRHLFRIDERTLPEGSFLTTEKVVVVDITPGLPVKVNFGVKVDAAQLVSEDNRYFLNKVTTRIDQSRPTPRLHAEMFGSEVLTLDDIVVKQAEFRIYTNYAAFVNRWELRIVDRDTKRVVRTFTGNRFNIFDPIYWDGKDDNGKHINLDFGYDYYLVVEDDKGHRDETSSQPITFKEFEEEQDLEDYLEEQAEDPVDYVGWIDSLQEKDSLLVQNIFINGETLYVDPFNADVENIRVLQGGNLVTEFTVTERHKLTAQELLDGDKFFKRNIGKPVEIILPIGDYELMVKEKGQTEAVSESVLMAEGVELQPAEEEQAAAYVKPITIGRDSLFFVSMGDAKIGYTISKENIEPVAQDDAFRQGFWQEGKFAYYLQGKVLGKYLVTSSYDTEREQKEIFRKIDEDKYYPVYGDQSTIDYEATNTQGNLYLAIEWDKSSAVWSNYDVSFGDTEFAQYSRSLYGGKVDFESVSATKFGDPTTKIVVFNARSKQKSAHNEFLATGGSLYYMKHKDILEGSDKVSIEIRDKITGLTVTSKEMVEGADYEMDYDSGRIIFWKPVPQIVTSYSLVSDELLDGNLVYVMVDYEYDVLDKVDESDYGARAKQAVTDNLIVGTTYVKEDQDNTAYELKAADVTYKFTEEAKVVAEYAETISDQEGTFVSTDGGLSFAEVTTADGARGQAYGIRGDARLFNRLGVASYYKWIDNDFSTSATTTQTGKELYGIELTYDLGEATRVVARQDIQLLIEDGTSTSKLQLGAVKTSTTLINILHQVSDRLTVTAEYKKTEVTDRLDQFDTQTNTEDQTVAVKAEYQVSDKLELSLEQQISTQEGDEDQTTVAATYKPSDKLEVTVSETIGDSGTATGVMATADVSERLSVTGGYAIKTDEEKGLSTTTTFGVEGDVGDAINLGDKLKLSATQDITASKDGLATTTSVGAEADITDKVKLTAKHGVTADQGVLSNESSVGADVNMAVDDKTSVKSSVLLSDATTGDLSTTMTFGGVKQVDDKTSVTTDVSVTQTAAEASKQFSFGTTKKISQDLEFATIRKFGDVDDAAVQETEYKLTRANDGRKLTGSLVRKYSDGKEEISASNIFGLTGDIDDRWAAFATYEQGQVQNIDGTKTDRDVVSVGIGYAKEDPETGARLESSSKLEFRKDRGDEDINQVLISNVTEGQVTPELSVETKLQYSKTQDKDTGEAAAEFKEIIIGGAYRPIYHDKLNLIARYTYLEELSPESQEDTADIEEERSHVFSAEAIYELSQRWQLTEKFAYRILDEKVSGFDFTKTHTWLMIHRLDYKFDKDWSIGGEFRSLAVEEAEDIRRGFLIEAQRTLGEFAQLGVGFNFTDFNDDLTNLDYTSFGPFVRITGKFYDRTPEEIERAKQQWLDQKISIWAWKMVDDELARQDSPIIAELNEYFILAQVAYKEGRAEDAHQIYKDIVIAGEMMFEEAAEHIRERIRTEENLQSMSEEADRLMKEGQYEKAKKILEKILEEAE